MVRPSRRRNRHGPVMNWPIIRRPPGGRPAGRGAMRPRRLPGPHADLCPGARVPHEYDVGPCPRRERDARVQMWPRVVLDAELDHLCGPPARQLLRTLMAPTRPRAMVSSRVPPNSRTTVTGVNAPRRRSTVAACRCCWKGPAPAWRRARRRLALSNAVTSPKLRMTAANVAMRLPRPGSGASSFRTPFFGFQGHLGAGQEPGMDPG